MATKPIKSLELHYTMIKTIIYVIIIINLILLLLLKPAEGGLQILCVDTI